MISSEVYPNGHYINEGFALNNAKKLDFFIVGTAKCGTTSLLQNLNLHPSITTIGETRFFSNPRNGKPSVEKMKKWFSDKLDTDNILGAKDHLESFESFQNLYQYNPDIKLIFCIREPPDRCISEYNHRTSQSGWELEAGTLKDQKDLLGRGLYINIIKMILRIFPKKQLHIVVAEEFKKNINQTMKNIFKYLEVQDDTFELQFSTSYHKREYDKTTIFTKEELAFLDKYYQEANQELFKYLGYNPWSSLQS